MFAYIFQPFSLRQFELIINSNLPVVADKTSLLFNQLFKIIPNNPQSGILTRYSRNIRRTIIRTLSSASKFVRDVFV